jgi:hypothetical protein
MINLEAIFAMQPPGGEAALSDWTESYVRLKEGGEE